MVKKKLADYLDMFSWSQADLARAADVSPHCIRRALRGEPIARRNAAKIAAALTERLNGQGIVQGFVQKWAISLGGVHYACPASSTASLPSSPSSWTVSGSKDTW
jgi:DNA-binding XRE family transcriptional regulator